RSQTGDLSCAGLRALELARCSAPARSAHYSALSTMGGAQASRTKSFFQNVAPAVSPTTAWRRRAPDDPAPLRSACSRGRAVERNTQGSGAGGKSVLGSG